MYIKYKKLNLSKVNSNYLIKDFVYIVDLITLSWLEYWQN